jgi:DNA helicase II / ATP-dependent DNA helicase PcrA
MHLKLTAEQNAVIQAQKGALLVLAPVGSGKTTVLTQRLKRALEDGTSPEHCLCLTFTNRAANELRTRIRGALEQGQPLPQTLTFHRFCAQMLREDSVAAGLDPDFGIIDDEDSTQILTRFLGTEDQHPERLGQALYYRWSAALSALPMHACKTNSIPAACWKFLPDKQQVPLKSYLQELRASNSIDFGLLVYLCRALLFQDKEASAKWASRYTWIQVDEVQDTHSSEWDILRHLSLSHKNLALFGDLDQQIYGWRGSYPDAILKSFESEFASVAHLDLTINQRGTRNILSLADHVAKGLPHRFTRLNPSPSLPTGEDLTWLPSSQYQSEADLCAKHLLKQRDKFPDQSIAVLVRAHWIGHQIALALQKNGLETLSEKDLKLGRRPIIKALMAPLKLLVNPGDRQAFRHWITYTHQSRHFSKSIQALLTHGTDCHLKLTDLLQKDTLRLGDPFAKLLQAWRERFVVVMDFETTGLDTEIEDIIEIACQRYSGEFRVDEFHRLLQTSRNLDSSQNVHGITAEALREKGIDASEGLRDLLTYLGDALLIGHNLRFDLAVLRSQAARLNLSLPPLHYEDTLNLARRVVGNGSMKLGDLRNRLGLPSVPTHRAMDDVQTTAELLAKLIPTIEAGEEDRHDLIQAWGAPFEPFAAHLEELQSLSQTLRPWQLARHISQLPEFQGVTKKADETPIKQVIEWLQHEDEESLSSLPPARALEILLTNNTLAQPTEHLKPGVIPVLTMHAAKGMEFDHVHLAGMTNGVLPGKLAATEEALNEERRLCYVAITRAKQSLSISCDNSSGKGWSDFVTGYPKNNA